MLTVGKGRTRWATPFKRGEGPLCQSFDGKMSFDNKIVCATCPFNDWNNLPAGQDHPDCTMRYVWACAERSDDPQKNMQPFTLTAHGSSVSPTKDLISYVKLHNIRLTYAKAIITAKKVQNSKGTFYVVQYDFDTDDMGKVQYVDSLHEAEALLATKEGMIKIMKRAVEYDIGDTANVNSDEDAFE